MNPTASSYGWNADAPSRNRGKPRRGLEIAGIILGFIFVWPLALTYLVWKLAGYPYAAQMKAAFERAVGGSLPFARPFPAASTGNLAFEEYRRAELARLDEERRRLDDEARAFTQFVEDLKRAKDREEFETFRARRAGPAA
jgi:hypothetical protein